jgi:hypothetical protein
MRLKLLRVTSEGFSPIGSRIPLIIRINFDGLLKHLNADQAAGRQRAYVQLFRAGIVEAVTSNIILTGKGQPIIFNFEDEIIFACAVIRATLPMLVSSRHMP